MTSEADFLAARDAWNRLADDVTDASVFLRHEWFEAAWQWVRKEAELHLVAVWSDEQLVGVAPLIQVQRPGSTRTRTLKFLTVPDTQHCDILAAPHMRMRVLGAVWEALKNRRWDVLDLSHLTSSAAQELIDVAKTFRRPAVKLNQSTNPGIEVTGTWKDYYGRRSRRLKKGNNLIQNKLKKGGHQYRVTECTGAELLEPSALESALQDMVSISGRSWKHETGLSLDFPAPNAFARKLCTLAARNGWLSVWKLEIDGKALAMELQLRYRGAIHALRSDFDQSASELSPGTFLNWKMLEQLFGRGDRCYLMGPGENAYKLRWAETFDPVQRVIIYGSSARAQLLAAVDIWLRPALRWARDRWRARHSSRKANP